MDIEDRIKACQEPQELLALIAECHDYNTLFKVWKVYNEKNPLQNKINGKMVCEKSAFTSDGVLRLPEDRHIKWDESSYPKVLFILKDQYQDAEDENKRWDEDIRDWLIWDDGKNPKKGDRNLNLMPDDGRTCIFRQLGRWLYGAKCIITKDNFIPYEEVTDEVIKNLIRDYPMAIMEAKKQPGGPTLDKGILAQYLDRDEVFIKREIELLDPEIIICCDKSGNIYKKLLSMFNAECNDPSHCIGKIRDHTLVINTDHPSARKKRLPYYQVIRLLRAHKLCVKVKKFAPQTKNVLPSLDWNVWGDGINIQYPIKSETVEPRIGIEAYYTSDNKFRIFLAVWGNFKEEERKKRILVEIFGETLTWESKKLETNCSFINKPGAILEEIKDSQTIPSDEIAKKVADCHSRLYQLLVQRSLD